ncbi:predicted protein [Naegleria gruberi]|uniref:Predicted protein n=1 Tax=Naegleria gruberi TaxID=5762 RepID=D2VDQ5_NAEGR|nr:uncharacterized protein NAEGRDRAFT_67003 [Naegleria gruberi]EFC44937.1 predicted protein [Naegleria gruberi]|eukprot:XP_002677681.1 predicted protein [Naegleria gruberi strain NEG-M]
MQSDAFQWRKSENRLLSSYYREWWFFATYDPKADVGFCMGYNVQDPLRTFNKERSSMAGMIWPSVQKQQKVIDVEDYFTLDDFKANEHNASMQITPNNYIQVLDSENYVIVGSSHNVKWWLQFTQTCYACREVIQVPEVIQLDWISYMPAAKVKGIIQIDGRNISIDTIGYHDHNYGSWPASLFDWIWSQFNHAESDLAIVTGSYKLPLTSESVGYAFIRFRGKRIKIGTLCANSFELIPLEWKNFNGKMYCVRAQVKTHNKDWKLEMEYRAQVSDRNPGDRGLGLFVYEQISHFSVQLYEKVSNEWKVAANVTGYGFSEWTDLKYFNKP